MIFLDSSSLSSRRSTLPTTEVGRAIYAKRKSTIEPVFGIIRAVMGFRRFLLRGLQRVAGEWDLVCIAYNLKVSLR